MSSGEVGAGAGSSTNTVPLYSKDSTEGSITYLASKETLDATPGFFVFTYYIRSPIFGEQTYKQSSLYLDGLNAYRKIVEKTSSFKSWKLIIYTDQYTYDEMKRQTYTKVNISNTNTMDTRRAKYKEDVASFNIFTLSKILLEDPNVVFAIVSWPKHQRLNTVAQINGPALRTLRARAPFDFPKKYIFIRDADTLFEKNLKAISIDYKVDKSDFSRKIFIERLSLWEEEFFNCVKEIEKMKQKPLLITGTGEGYIRKFHPNEVTGKKPPFGVLAGFINATPGVPIFQTMDVWDEIIDYVDSRSTKTNSIRHPALNKELSSLYGYNTVYDFIKEGKNSKVTYDEFINGVLQTYPEEDEKKKEKQRLDSLKSNQYYEYTNNVSETSVGRDEQVYSYILLPKTKDNLFFFKILLGSNTEESGLNLRPEFSNDDMKKVFTYERFQRYWESMKPKINMDFHDKKMKQYIDALAKNFKGGKQKTKKTRRIKFEKRKTRKSRY
jgi:hypothetical protein